MAIVDKPDLKTGFWIAIGVFLALVLIGLFRALAVRALERRNG